MGFQTSLILDCSAWTLPPAIPAGRGACGRSRCSAAGKTASSLPSQHDAAPVPVTRDRLFAQGPGVQGTQEERSGRERIQDLNTGAFNILGISRDQDQVMRHGRGRQQAINHRQGIRDRQYCPAFSDLFCDGQDTALIGCDKLWKPGSQAMCSSWIFSSQKLDASPKLTDN